MIKHTIRLQGKSAKGDRISFRALQRIAEVLTEASQRALRLRVENRSNLHNLPGWMEEATEIQFLGISKGSTILQCEIPSLGEAAPGRFDQIALFEKEPLKQKSALSLLEETLRDASAGDKQSDMLDRNTLNSVVRFREILTTGFESLTIDGSAENAPKVDVTETMLSRVKMLRDEAPPSQRVVISGTLDELKGSKQAFLLKLKNGQTLRGQLPPKDPRSYKDLFNEFVVVDGEAHYRLSGKISSISATNIQIASERDRAFENLPRARPRSLDAMQPKILPALGTNGMSNVFGKFKVDDSDEEIMLTLKRMG